MSKVLKVEKGSQKFCFEKTTEQKKQSVTDGQDRIKKKRQKI